MGKRARCAGEGATHIEVLTYRAGAHSSSDDPSRYRPGDEHEAWPGGDPVDRLVQHLVAIGEWSEEQQKELEERVDGEVMAALQGSCYLWRSGQWTLSFSGYNLY